MANKVIVTLEIDDKGNLKQVGQDANKAGKQVGNMTKNTQSADRAMKGLSAQSSNTTKNFSKMSQGLTGGLVPAYATLAANIFAVSAAFRFLESAANYRMLIAGQQEWATITGESLSLITSRLQEATGQQLAYSEAAQSTAIARAAGVSTDQIERLGIVAKNASIALGRDLTDSVNRLIRGTTKAEPELLDELGIILRLETASKNYAAAIGKTAKELTIFEKTQAVTNEVLRQGEEKFGSFQTPLNSFTKLAKSFDDLLNKIKGSLSGVAEFMAGALSKNVIALAGGFTLLGSSIIRSLTPEAPTYDSDAVMGKAQGDIGKMYTGKMKPGADGRFSDKQLRMMKKYAAREKSTVFDTENFTRQQRVKTVETLMLQQRRLEISQSTGLKKWALEWKLTMEMMIRDHGKFVGRLKIAQMGLMKALSWAGWIGMALSAFGIIKQLIYEYTTDEETKKFHELQDRLVEKFDKQATELTKLNNSLVQHKNIMAEINQLGKFFGNISYADADQGINIGQIQAASVENMRQGGTGTFWDRTKVGLGKAWDFINPYQATDHFTQEELDEMNKKNMEDRLKSGFDVIQFDADSRSIVNDIITTLESEKAMLKPSSEFYKDTVEDITALKAALDAESIDDPDKIMNILKRLATEGSPAAKSLATLGNVIRGTNDAILTHTNAMGALTVANTEFSKITNTYRDLGKAYGDIANKLEDVKDAQIKSDKIFTDTNLDWFEKRLGKEAFMEPPKDAEGNVLEGWLGNIMYDEKGKARTAKEKIRVLGEYMAAEGQRLHDKEVKWLTKATQLETTRLTQIRGMPKLVAGQINKLAKVSSISNEIARIEDYRKELINQGVEDNAVAIAQEDEKLRKKRAQLAIAQDEASLLKEMKQSVLDSFATGITTMIDGLIQGTMTLKEGFASMAKSILTSISQILAKMAALAVLDFFLPGFSGWSKFLAGGGYMQGKGQRKVPGYRNGGIVTEPTYMVGEGKYNEAVVPLPDGRTIPVQMKGGTGTANVTVNVMSDGRTSESLVSNDGQQAANLGRAISTAVQEELHKQQRPGGILSPYGAS